MPARHLVEAQHFAEAMRSGVVTMSGAITRRASDFLRQQAHGASREERVRLTQLATQLDELQSGFDELTDTGSAQRLILALSAIFDVE